MTVPFPVGFNDLYVLYAQNNWQDLFNKTRDCGTAQKTIRFNVEWNVVQQNSPGEFNFSPYVPVALEAQRCGLRVLPVLIGCPTIWIPEPSGRGIAPNGGTVWYPKEPYWDEFAEFAVRTIQHFDAYGVIDAVEVWNEPNLYTVPPTGEVISGETRIPDPAIYGGLLHTVTLRIVASQASFSHEMKVLGGSLSLVGNNWQSYLAAFDDDPCVPFKLAIHPYDTRHQSAAEMLERLKWKYEQVVAASGRDLWVTETGSTSNPPLNQSGQAEVVNNFYDYLRNSPRCKGMIVFRLVEGGGAPAKFAEYSLLDFYWNPKSAYTTLDYLYWN